MNGKELIRKLKKYGKTEGVQVYYGNKFTTMKNPRTEIGEGLLKAMCRQLGVDRKKI